MIKYGIKIKSPIKDDTTQLTFYGDTIEEVREYLRNNCIYYKFVPKTTNDNADK